jgi:hypothetical protein
MNRRPPGCENPKSSTLRTRIPKLTFARMGFSFVSNASSVMEKSVSRTGTTRLLLQTNSVSTTKNGVPNPIQYLSLKLRAADSEAGLNPLRPHGAVV